MKRIAYLLMLCFLVTGVAIAEETLSEAVTVEGKVMCAKCALHEEDREKCQNVLAVEKGEEVVHYYLTGKANTSFGDVCMKTPAVRATGTISEKDGHMWLAVSKLEKVDKDG